MFPDWGVGVEEETVLLFLMFPLGRKERGKLSHVFLALRRGEFKPHLSGLTLGLKHLFGNLGARRDWAIYFFLPLLVQCLRTCVC